MKFVPGSGSPPMPTRSTGRVERACCPTASYVSVPERETMPIGPGLVDVPRHDADLRLARRDDAGAVRADQARRLCP